MRICVARAKAGSEVVDVDAALSALAVAAREWRPFPWSVAEALSHLQRDWPEEQLHDFVVSACQTTERGATADILATWLTEVLEAYRDAVTALTFDKRFPTQDHPPSFWEGDFPLWRLLNHTVVVSTTLVMAWLGTANIEPPPQLRANCMWRLVETAEATLMSASMTSELRRSAERWFP
jgi:hypothetical protein